MAREWSCRPSALYSLRDDVLAWCFDRAVFTFGKMVEADIERATDGVKTKKAAQTKAHSTLMKWIAEPGETKGRFKDPMAAVRAKKEREASGV